MKKYYEQSDKIMIKDLENNLSFPKDLSNRHYEQFLQEVQNGTSELVPYININTSYEDIKIQRDTLLKNTDWVVLDSRLANKQDWENYRQILRDIPQSFKTPESVIWPIQPPIIEQF